jgi:hypothetical protein
LHDLSQDVLSAAQWHQQGITNNDPVETVSTTADIMVAQNVLGQNAEASSLYVSSFSVIQHVVMQNTNAPLSGLATPDIIMQGPDAPYPELCYIHTWTFK